MARKYSQNVDFSFSRRHDAKDVLCERHLTMRLASAAFVLLLLGAHATGNIDQCLETPLSMFRDGPYGWLGYLLFVALLLVCVLYAIELIRGEKEEEAVVAGLAALLLFLVAVTPSFDLFHILCSFVLMLLLFTYYWRLLYEAGS